MWRIKSDVDVITVSRPMPDKTCLGLGATRIGKNGPEQARGQANGITCIRVDRCLQFVVNKGVLKMTVGDERAN